MPFRNEFCRRFELQLPVIQAPMAGGGDTAELVAAVCEAGGLGFIGAAYLTPEQIVTRAREVRALTRRPFGINLFAPARQETAAVSVEHAMERVAPHFSELGVTATAPAYPADQLEEQMEAVLEAQAAAFSFTQ